MNDVSGEGKASIRDDLISLVTNKINPHIYFIEFGKYKHLLKSYRPEYILGFTALTIDIKKTILFAICKKRVLNFLMKHTQGYSKKKIEAKYDIEYKDVIKFASWVCNLDHKGASYSIIVDGITGKVYGYAPFTLL